MTQPPRDYAEPTTSSPMPTGKYRVVDGMLYQVLPHEPEDIAREMIRQSLERHYLKHGPPPRDRSEWRPRLGDIWGAVGLAIVIVLVLSAAGWVECIG